MIGFRYDGEVPAYLKNEIYPAVVVFIHRGDGEAPWRVCVPRVVSMQFGDHASVFTHTLSPSLVGRRLSSTFVAPTLHIHAPARLAVRLAGSSASSALPAYALRIESVPVSGVFRGPDEYARGWGSHTHRPGDHYAPQHGPSSHTHDLVTGRVDTVMGEARPAGR